MKEYLGDAVYAEFDQYGDLVLTTSDGERDTNRIVLEPFVLQALAVFVSNTRVVVTPKATKEAEGKEG